MTVRDKWAKRPCVMRYRAFADEVRANNVVIQDSGNHVIFYMPIPKSWSKKKKLEMIGKPHQQKPDWDNLAKALCDAVHSDDSFIFDFRATKLWAEKGAIEVKYNMWPEV